ncbi:fucolectin-7-like [Asterias rubens]|uniref:fucolectin-7-like n=1 Tax=Asterias rubens TaxID=7604 RepID=UPI001455CD24|nr:fucolectin-7-like [Asterias rubens]
MAHSERLEKSLPMILFGILVWFCLLSCIWCHELTVLNLHGMQATQVSTYSHRGVNLSADLAIDNDLRTQVEEFSCAHTMYDPHLWWKVDLVASHCLGHITLVNRGGCCNERLSGAIVRAGIESDILNNAACGLPVTTDQASIPGAHLQFVCDPPVIARYVSVDDADHSNRPYDDILTLCEVIVEEYPMEGCVQMTTATTMDKALPVADILSSLLFEGKYIVEPRPLSVLYMKSPMQCFLSCKMNGYWSFDYVMTSGQCRLYDVKAGDLKADDQPGCLVYAVVRG